MEAITVNDISKVFKDGSVEKEILKPTAFKVEQGEFVAIIGPSGSGKSTLLTIIGGLQKPTKGNVMINGNDFSAKSEKKRAKVRFKEIGFILQSSNLVPFLSVINQLELVDKVEKRKSDKERQKQLLTDLGIWDLRNKYPEALSGGEKQRVAIARALYNDPAVILADEPTASLDTDRAFEVVKILADESKAKNKACIMVTHDIRMIEHCDRVFEMRDGTLTERK
ncbi:ABC transporter ATP-binding protein [Culicoidibacter larvae]|uniref:Putative hemin import ATP-binding protein HrtA n=1 Tax=Culicoidibacter larvae TaxID=2579976 RepID=A0A5R8QDU9_9FIRM|nr:ABC transporter ATP-binding protein [Culicoidibacter larvae]TLG75445.1 ABC transporter ATP-binding protein [Culicoidibacter larvae]